MMLFFISGLAVALNAPAPSIGGQIEAATSGAAVLAAASRIESPTPPFSAPHLAQDVHQLKRQSLACNALDALARLLIGSRSDAARHETLRDPRMAPLVRCAAAPSVCRADGEVAALDMQSARTVAVSLTALGTLCSADAVFCAQQGVARSADAASALGPLRDAVTQLVGRAETLAWHMELQDAVASRWAARRLLGARASTDRLNERTCRLPYDFVPGLIALPSADASLNQPYLPSLATLVSSLSADALASQIQFEQQALMTADGRKVRERRHTCWLAEEGIGALAYSGKLMSPVPLRQSVLVAALRDALHADLKERFDCCLANLYPSGGTAACAWHRDPEHGDAIDDAKWDRSTYVVSCGEARRFALRPCQVAPPAAIVAAAAGAGSATTHGDAASLMSSEAMRHVVPLYTGDVMVMHSNCNDDFEHSVLAAQGEGNAGARVSLVFKRALVGRDGRRGHTLEGQGRRARAARARTEGEERQHTISERATIFERATISERATRAVAAPSSSRANGRANGRGSGRAGDGARGRRGAGGARRRGTSGRYSS